MQASEQFSRDTGEIRVMLVDDHPVVRMGLRAGLERFGNLTVSCEAADGPSAIQLLRSHPIEVAVVDVRLPGIDGLETVTRMREIRPGLRVVLMSGYYDTYTLERALELKVDGFVLKHELPQQLVLFIRQVFEGRFCCSDSIRDLLEPDPENGGWRISSRHGVSLASLTKNERELLKCLADAASLKQAARMLGITYKSADHLKQDLMKKLQVHDRVQLVQFAIREGLVRHLTPPSGQDRPPVGKS